MFEGLFRARATTTAPPKPPPQPSSRRHATDYRSCARRRRRARLCPYRRHARPARARHRARRHCRHLDRRHRRRSYAASSTVWKPGGAPHRARRLEPSRHRFSGPASFAAATCRKAGMRPSASPHRGLADPLCRHRHEFNTGHEIWLTMAGSPTRCALPTHSRDIPPVRIGGRWLVDGALVNPVPVSAARALGARVVIAVNLNSDLFGRGTIIANHGSDDSDDPPEEERPARPVTENARCAVGSSARAGGPAFRPSWWKPSTSCRTASRARGLPAIRPTC